MTKELFYKANKIQHYIDDLDDMIILSQNNNVGVIAKLIDDYNNRISFNGVEDSFKIDDNDLKEMCNVIKNRIEIKREQLLKEFESL